MDYSYILTKTKIWMLRPSVKRILKEGFISAGMLLAEKRISGWKLVNGSVQVLGDRITKRRLKISREKLIQLFADKKIAFDVVADGYYVLEYENRPMASVFVGKGEMKVRLPHAFRLIL